MQQASCLVRTFPSSLIAHGRDRQLHAQPGVLCMRASRFAGKAAALVVTNAEQRVDHQTKLHVTAAAVERVCIWKVSNAGLQTCWSQTSHDAWPINEAGFYHLNMQQSRWSPTLKLNPCLCRATQQVL